MQTDIQKKLRAEVEGGVTKESQVVYILACVRKILEQQDDPEEFGRLKFYCDWTLHSKMSKKPAQEVVRTLESIYACMLKKERAPEGSEAMSLISFESFQKELSSFFQKFGIRDLTKRTNAWVVFMYLYAKVVEDCPLMVHADIPLDIKKIVIQVEKAKEMIDDHQPYRVNWKFEAKDGLPPALYFILNSYSVSQGGPEEISKA